MYFSLMGVGIQCCKRNEVSSSLELRQNIRVDPFASKLQTSSVLAVYNHCQRAHCIGGLV